MTLALVIIVGIFAAACAYALALAPWFHPPRTLGIVRGLTFAGACVVAAAVALVSSRITEPHDMRLSMLSSLLVIGGSLVIVGVSVLRRSMNAP